MIREERDPAFWIEVATHPEVEPHITFGGSIDRLPEVITQPHVTPLASANGGFLFVRIDAIGRVHELHTVYRPEGWGREVLIAAKAAFQRMFESGAQLITTYEVFGWWRSRPPLSFGFKPCGDFAPAPDMPDLRTWILTRDAWCASAAHRRM